MEKEIHSRFRLFHRFQIGVAAMEIYKFIRVLALPEMHYTELQPNGAGDFQSPLRSILPGRIHIVTENHFICIFFQKPGLLDGKGGPKGSHRIGHAVGMKGNGIHVSFYHNGLFFGLNGGQSLINGKEKPSFVENGTFRRVQILGLAVIHDAAAKGHDFSGKVPYGKHAAVAEHIVITTILISAESCFHQKISADLLLGGEISIKLLPVRRRKSKLEFFNGLHGKMALIKVGKTGLPHLCPGKAAVEIGTGQLRHRLELAGHGGPPFFLRRFLPLRHVHMSIIGQAAHCFHKGEMIHLFYERNGIAALMTAEAVIKSLIR